MMHGQCFVADASFLTLGILPKEVTLPFGSSAQFCSGGPSEFSLVQVSSRSFQPSQIACIFLVHGHLGNFCLVSKILYNCNSQSIEPCKTAITSNLSFNLLVDIKHLEFPFWSNAVSVELSRLLNSSHVAIQRK
jgi:hypothetical protein